jgi:hypothetical protein
VTTLPSLEPGQLPTVVRRLVGSDPSAAALGIAAFEAPMSVELFLHSPVGEQHRRSTYGGHPRNLPRWALNLGLHLLRTMASSEAVNARAS